MNDYMKWMLVERPRGSASEEHKALYWSVRRSA